MATSLRLDVTPSCPGWDGTSFVTVPRSAPCPGHLGAPLINLTNSAVSYNKKETDSSTLWLWGDRKSRKTLHQAAVLLIQRQDDGAMEAVDRTSLWAGVRFGTIQSLELKRGGRRPRNQALQRLTSGQNRRAGPRRSKGVPMK